MSEIKTIYSCESSETEFNELLKSFCMLPLCDEKFTLPTPKEIKVLRTYLGLSQAQLGRFLGRKVTKKGCSIVRKWETDSGSAENRKIDRSSWRLMLNAAGLCDIKEDLKLL